MKISKETGEHYIWGINCDGWHLLKQDNLSIIHERMPPGTEEARHYHNRSRQFFFILLGKAVIEINGEVYELNQQEGIEVPQQTPHQIFNETDDSIEFLVISQPTTKGDRILTNN
ncbi:cupin domain-containing protein [Paenibacillus sp. BR2-3]|uniref:cupin domain-containing protein n=1 Tax=Paenibacillus sp. BR2-3 TaxID=3048494 RepID=UPI003977D959